MYYSVLCCLQVIRTLKFLEIHVFVQYILHAWDRLLFCSFLKIILKLSFSCHIVFAFLSFSCDTMVAFILIWIPLLQLQVILSPDANPPVVKIMNYRYDMNLDVTSYNTCYFVFGKVDLLWGFDKIPLLGDFDFKFLTAQGVHTISVGQSSEYVVHNV